MYALGNNALNFLLKSDFFNKWKNPKEHTEAQARRLFKVLFSKETYYQGRVENLQALVSLWSNFTNI